MSKFSASNTGHHKFEHLSWYYEKFQNSNRLIVTTGDSWTWGDSLGNANASEGIDDFEYRTTHIYGSLLAEKLQCDLINVAECGVSNIIIHDRLCSILPNLVTKYKNIDVVITLTEMCREITDDPIWNPNTSDYDSLMSLLSSYEKNMMNSFATLFNEWPKINFLLARNFTQTYSENKLPQEVTKTWMDIIQDNQELGKFPAVPVLSNLGILPLEQFIKNINYKQVWKTQFNELMYTISEAWNWLDLSKHNSKQSTRPPNEQAHLYWAQYLYNFLKK